MGGFEPLAFLISPENLVFSGALLLMLLISAIEAIGVGSAAFGLELDADTNAGADHLLGWLGFGRLPFSILLIVFLTLFGLIGLCGQQGVAAAAGAALTPWLAVPAVAAVALPLTGAAAQLLARIMPRDETTAIPIDQLVGRRAVMVHGRATTGSPARARAEDRFGQAHYVMVEPNTPNETLEEGEVVLLVARDGHHFRAVARGVDRLLDGI